MNLRLWPVSTIESLQIALLVRVGCFRHPIAALCLAFQPAPSRPAAPLLRTVSALEGARRSRPRRGGGSCLAEARFSSNGAIRLREPHDTFAQVEPPRADRILAPPPRAAAYPARPFFSSIFLGQQKNGPRREGMEHRAGAASTAALLAGQKALEASPVRTTSPRKPPSFFPNKKGTPRRAFSCPTAGGYQKNSG
ncbi:hypothetical protein DND132_1680 [Pseudodesulfovibrio mercurii]|uniref:Uncharacterized protein n=1 Tax=Pseudodesulfovibrio mercurii TaxID=641491 RepID=F0JFG2_9BACT|nr:hypothetical protein DND132_1680 [Pseudodesulfovibrio mercurii]